MGEGLSSSKQTSLLIPYSTHLQAGHPDAHRPHEQQVVGQELLQLGDAAALEGNSRSTHLDPAPGERREGRAGRGAASNWLREGQTYGAWPSRSIAHSLLG